jgi:hypothetical protein
VALLVVPVFRDAAQAVLVAQESSAPTITGDALKLSASSLSARSPGAPGAKHGGHAALAGQVDAAGGGGEA